MRNFKKAKVWVSLVALALCVLAAVLIFTTRTEGEPETTENIAPSSTTESTDTDTDPAPSTPETADTDFTSFTLTTDFGNFEGGSGGFYRVNEDGSQTNIYPDYIGTGAYTLQEDHFFYFTVDLDHTSDSLDYVNNGVIQVDLTADEWELIYDGRKHSIDICSLKTENRNGQHFLSIYNHPAMPSYTTDPIEQIYLNDVSEPTVYDPPEDPLRPVIGRAYEIGTLNYGVGNEKGIRNFDGVAGTFHWDLNMDGVKEDISITLEEGCWSQYYPAYDSGHYTLQIEDSSVQDYADFLSASVQVISLDGNEYLLMLYDDGPSGDPITTFYHYENGEIQEAGTIPQHILNCTVNGEGQITGLQRFGLLQTEAAICTWALDKNNSLEMLVQEYHLYPEPYTYYTRSLLVELPIHEEMDLSSPSQTLAPQKVTFLYTDLEHWIYAEGEDSTAGWFYLENPFEITELEMKADDVFSDLNHAG